MKIVAIDLDGTLFDDNKKITDKNKEVIKKAIEQNHKIVIATGRPFFGITNTLDELNLLNTDNYVICFNGGLIYHLKTNSIIYSNTITGKDVLELYKDAIKHDVNIHAFYDTQKLISPKMSKYTTLECDINKIDCEYVDFKEFIKEDDLFVLNL